MEEKAIIHNQIMSGTRRAELDRVSGNFRTPHKTFSDTGQNKTNGEAGKKNTHDFCHGKRYNATTVFHFALDNLSRNVQDSIEYPLDNFIAR